MRSTGVRRLCVLVEGLPVDSALHRGGRLWTQADELAAVAIEDNAAWTRLAVAIHLDAAGKKKLPPATTLKHPDRVVAKPAKKKANAADVARLFGGR